MTDRLADLPDEVCVGALGAVELIALAARLGADRQLVAGLYRAWIACHPDDPLRYAITFNLAVVLSNLGDTEGACAASAAAIALNPDFIPATINCAMALERLGRPGEAIARLNEACSRLGGVNAESVGNKIAALKQLARMLSTANLAGSAEAALRQSLEVAPTQRDVRQHWLSLRQRQFTWPVVEPVAGLTRAELVAAMSPLSLAAYTDDPLLQLGVAADYARHDVGRPAHAFAHTHRRLLELVPRGRLRVGYLSSDLRAHAIGYLMAELFERHDRCAVEIFAYYCGPPAEDALHARIKAAIEHWVDISATTDVVAAERIAADEIQILVDVNGYTHSARSGVVAMRPAPVIVNWLGFPSTTGSPYHGYIIADEVIIPPGSEMFYSETVKRLPCYQPNDRRRSVAAAAGTRAEAGLPEDGTVFCCFNASYKITPFAWRRWMAILRAVEGSVLWLLDGVESSNTKLRALAVAHGVAPARIVFAPILPNAQHLARYVHADLFLDTSPYGAHTTGSDALWMGVPVLTLPGRGFASRVCASLVTAAGLPELVCRSSEAFVARGIALGRDRAALAALRARLLAQRDGCVLFDTERLASCLEALFREMWEEAASGRMRRPDLANLEIYRDIGAALDHEDVEMAEVPDYQERYLAELAERHAFDVIRPDCRLWHGNES